MYFKYSYIIKIFFRYFPIIEFLGASLYNRSVDGLKVQLVRKVLSTFAVTVQQSLLYYTEKKIGSI